MKDGKIESPEYLRMSLAAAMTLGYKHGLFYRDAKLYCINLLLTYTKGCAARCAYCGLSNTRKGQFSEKSFIRVTWPTYPLDDIIQRISQRRNRIKRICISQVTNKRAIADTRTICRQLRSSFDIPVSLLISPTLGQALKNSSICIASLTQEGNWSFPLLCGSKGELGVAI